MHARTCELPLPSDILLVPLSSHLRSLYVISRGCCCRCATPGLTDAFGSYRSYLRFGDFSFSLRMTESNVRRDHDRQEETNAPKSLISHSNIRVAEQNACNGTCVVCLVVSMQIGTNHSGTTRDYRVPIVHGNTECEIPDEVGPAAILMGREKSKGSPTYQSETISHSDRARAAKGRR